MYKHLNSTTAPKGMSMTIRDISTHKPMETFFDKGYPSWDGEDVVCSQCGYILGWSNQEDMPECPRCGCRLDWSDND